MASLEEAMIHAWLEINMVVRENRLMDSLTLNEIAVCHYMHCSEQKGQTFVTATELSKRMQLFKSQINALISKMEKRGMIEKRRNRSDQRVQELVLTSKGE